MSENIKHITSRETALARLHTMKEWEQSSKQRIPNPTPPDNNKMWAENHNPMSSKGD